MDITVTLNKDDLYQAMKDYLAKHGQDVRNTSMSVDIKAGRGVAEANIGATVTLSTDPVASQPVANPQVDGIAPLEMQKPDPAQAVVDAANSITPEETATIKQEVKAAKAKPPFDDDSADDAKKSLFEDPKGRTPAPNNPLFG